MPLHHQKLHKKATARKTEGGEREHTARRKRVSGQKNTDEHSTKVTTVWLVYSPLFIFVTAPVCHLDISLLNEKAQLNTARVAQLWKFKSRQMNLKERIQNC